MIWSRASVRTRTTVAAVLVVAVALALAAVLLVVAVRASLQGSAEGTAEQRADELVAQIAVDQLPLGTDDDDDDGRGDDDDDDDDDQPRATESAGPTSGQTLDLRGQDDDLDPAEVVWQVLDESGSVISASQTLARDLPTDDGRTRLAGAEHDYVVVTEKADGDHLVIVAVSLEDVDETTAALIPPLAFGLPLLLLVVGGITWLVATRALAPVERIRREVDEISGARLDRRVYEPATRDEIGRLARTMNLMLGRLQASRDHQQQFIADASHELRSPIAGLRQTAEVELAHPGALPEGELVEAVLEETARMQLLVDQLLALARAGEGGSATPDRDVDLDDLALIEARRIDAPHLTVDTAQVAPARLVGDPVALGQVVRNLLANAARHARSRVAVAVSAQGGWVQLTVDDDGSGIAPEDRARVFDRFVRLDEARARDMGGSGLGLAIVHAVVTRHGGAVEIAESPHGGARFVVRLPECPGT